MSDYRRSWYVSSWGMFFCFARGWVDDPGGVRPICRAAAIIVAEEQPGVVLVEVSA